MTGASRIPLRWWPVATTTRSSRRPISGALSGVPGRRPATSSSISQLEDARDQLGGVAQQLVHGERGHRGVEAALLHRRAERSAARRRAARGSRVSKRSVRSSSGAPRSRIVWPLTGRTGSGASPALHGPAASTTCAASTCVEARHLGPGRAARRRRARMPATSAAGERARVDRVVVGELDRQADARRQRRLERARRAGQQPRARAGRGARTGRARARAPPSRRRRARPRACRCVRNPTSSAAARRAARRRTRPTSARSRGRARAARAPARRPRWPGASIPAATRVVAAAELAAVEHDDAQPARAGAPGHGQADDTAADDGDVETAGGCRVDSLRRHDPEQVRTVGDRIAALSAPGAPVAIHGSPLWETPGHAAARRAPVLHLRDRPAATRSSPRCAAASTSSSCATSTRPTTSCCAPPRPRGALCDEHGALFVLNDRPDLAVAAGADGVHVGQDDMPVAAGARDRRARRADRPLDAQPRRRSTRAARRGLHRRRAGARDADEARPAGGRASSSSATRPRTRSGAVLRHRRHRRGDAARRGRRRRDARGGRAGDQRGRRTPRRRRARCAPRWRCRLGRRARQREARGARHACAARRANEAARAELEPLHPASARRR